MPSRAEHRGEAVNSPFSIWSAIGRPAAIGTVEGNARIDATIDEAAGGGRHALLVSLVRALPGIAPAAALDAPRIIVSLCRRRACKTRSSSRKHRHDGKTEFGHDAFPRPLKAPS